MELLSAIHLSELQLQVREVLSSAFPTSIWVIGEVASVRKSPQGHTYIELVEKTNGRVTAQAKATIWASQLHIVGEFQRQTGQALATGAQLLLQVKVHFHEVYGLSLNVMRIDSTYTLGEMARRKAETLSRLEAEGCNGLNAAVALAEVPQHIAVVTAEMAAGWGDFKSRLQNNRYGASFAITLFAAAMQGEGAEPSILVALASIAARQDEFDCVIIIRGGGGAVDLSCFDSYALGRAIATFPLPVLTGIGHERDVSVADLMAHRRLETPTAVAEFLADKVRTFVESVDDCARRIAASGTRILGSHQRLLQEISSSVSISAHSRLHGSELRLRGILTRVDAAVIHCVQQHSHTLTALQARCVRAPVTFSASASALLEGTRLRLEDLTKRTFERNISRLELWAKTVELRDPASVLRQGYSITRFNGKALRTAEGVKLGSRIHTVLQLGTLSSTVEAKEEGDTLA
jgi:exodeoxyribonuclease VII large subunit